MEYYIFVIPLYNKSNVIDKTIQLLKTKFKNSDLNVKFLFVENGSTDDSYTKFLSLTRGDERFEIIRTNKGFGIALREGLCHVYKNNIFNKGNLIFTGADLPFGFSDFDNYLNEKQRQSFDLYIGSKAHPDSVIDRSLLRKALSVGFNKLLNFFFQIKLGDTTGSFIINLNSVDISKLLPQSNNFFASTELVLNFINSGYKVREIPIICVDSDTESSVKIFSDTITTLKDMIYFKMNKNR